MFRHGTVLAQFLFVAATIWTLASCDGAVEPLPEPALTVAHYDRGLSLGARRAVVGCSGSRCHGNVNLPTPATLAGAGLGSSTVPVRPGKQYSYTLTLNQGAMAGTINGGGFVLETSGGTLAPADNQTSNLPGSVAGRSALAHAVTRSEVSGVISWTFNWTAPTTPGPVTVWAAVLGADNTGGRGGDVWRTDSWTVTVVANQAPTVNAGADQTVTDADGDGSEPVNLNGSASDPDGSIAGFVWTEGAKQIATIANPTVSLGVGQHTLTLTVTDDQGASASDNVSVTVQARAQSPIANANGPYQAQVGQNIAFSSSGSRDADGTIVSYSWDFGDGATSTQAHPNYTYVNTGSYAVVLTVTDNDGLSGSMTTTANIIATRAPLANANGPYSAQLGQSIAFSSLGSSDPDGTVVSFNWDFGDGNTSTQPNPNHTYGALGSYTVTLSVTDNDGLSSTAGTTADVTAAPAPPGTVSDYTFHEFDVTAPSASGDYLDAVALFFNVGDPAGTAELSLSVDGVVVCDTVVSAAPGPAPARHAFRAPACAYMYPTSGDYWVEARLSDDRGVEELSRSITVP